MEAALLLAAAARVRRSRSTTLGAGTALGLLAATGPSPEGSAEENAPLPLAP